MSWASITICSTDLMAETLRRARELAPEYPADQSLYQTEGRSLGATKASERLFSTDARSERPRLSDTVVWMQKCAMDVSKADRAQVAADEFADWQEG